MKKSNTFRSILEAKEPAQITEKVQLKISKGIKIPKNLDSLFDEAYDILESKEFEKGCKDMNARKQYLAVISAMETLGEDTVWMNEE